MRDVSVVGGLNRRMGAGKEKKEKKKMVVVVVLLLLLTGVLVVVGNHVRKRAALMGAERGGSERTCRVIQRTRREIGPC